MPLRQLSSCNFRKGHLCKGITNEMAESGGVRGYLWVAGRRLTSIGDYFVLEDVSLRKGGAGNLVQIEMGLHAGIIGSARS